MEKKKVKLLQTAQTVDSESKMELETENAENESSLYYLSKECVKEALGILACSYVITTEARVTSFFSIIRESVTSNSPLWEKATTESGAVVTDMIRLSERGKVIFERLFDGNMSSMDCSQLSEGKCISKFFDFVMNEDHTVCSLALNVIREHFRKFLGLFHLLISYLLF